MSELRDAATKAAVWGVVADAAKTRQAEAKAELAGLEAGDTLAAKIGGQVVAKVTMTQGRQTLSVTDPQAFLEWVRREHPSEIVESVNPAYLTALKESSKGKPFAVDADGTLVDGVEWAQGDPYVSVRKTPDAPFIVASLLSSGAIALDGIRQLEASE